MFWRRKAKDDPAATERALDTATKTLALAERALELVSSYVDVMEDYDAGYPISKGDHIHHDDWVKANKLLENAGWAGTREWYRFKRARAALDEVISKLEKMP